MNPEHASGARTDGALANVFTGLGDPKRDKSTGTYLKPEPILTQVDLELLYYCGIPRRYVDAIADEMLRHRVTIKLGEEQPDTQDTINAFERYVKNLRLHESLSEVVRLQRLYGGGTLVMLIDDGKPPEEPVSVDTIKSITGCVPLSRYELIPGDFTITDWSKPTYYTITTSQRIHPDQEQALINQNIHHTRVARFDGLYLPWNIRSRNTGWGMSCLQLVYNSFKRWETVQAGLESMVADADLIIHKLPGLFARLAAGGEADIIKRLELNGMSRSIYRGMLIDKEEDVTNLARDLANLATATEPFATALQADTGWPSSILLGHSPGGLGKEGRFEERVWASLVEQWQTIYCQSPIEEIFSLIFASKDGPTRGRIPDSWTVHFPSVFTETDTEKVTLRQLQSQIDSTYAAMKVLDPFEIRQARFGGTDYSIETPLNQVITDQAAARQEIAFEQELMNLQPPPPPEGEPQPPDPPSAKTDSAEMVLGQQTFQIIRQLPNLRGRFGYPVGARADHATAVAGVLLGPCDYRRNTPYRAIFDHAGLPVEGPFVLGYRMPETATAALIGMFPEQTGTKLRRLSTPEAEALRLILELQ